MVFRVLQGFGAAAGRVSQSPAELSISTTPRRALAAAVQEG